MADERERYRSVRDSVLVELEKFLRIKNSSPSRTSFWDRPIAITLVGGVLLTLVTTLWNTFETRRENASEYRRAILKDVFIQQQVDLMTDLPRAFDNTGTIINSWLVHILWLAEERNQTSPRTDEMDKWGSEISRLQQKYESAEPLEGLLKNTQVVFACQAVRDASNQLHEKWQALIALHHKVNRDFNDDEKIAISDIESYESERKAILENLENLKNRTIDGMRQELAGIRVGSLTCPP